MPSRKCTKDLSAENKQKIVEATRKMYDILKIKSDAVRKAAELFSVSDRTVYRLVKENEINGKSSPSKKKNNSGFKSKTDDFDKCSIRRIVHQFFTKNEIPTLDKILLEVQNDENITKISRTTLHAILKKDLGFKFVKRQRKNLLLERSDIVSWRRRYLREIKKLREEKKKIYFTDEMCINEGHTREKVQIEIDPAVTTTRPALNEGLSKRLRSPSEKGLIVTLIGSSTGFADEGLLCFFSEKSGNYREDMNSEVYEKWFEYMVTRLEQNSVIVLDNASYRSRKLNKAPSTSTGKDEIKTWLRNNDISFEDDMVKAELLDIVRLYKSKYETYVVDEMARAAGHKVIRLPPYHCELNPIELVWAEVKECIASQNKSFKMNEIQELLSSALVNVDSEKWNRCVQHVEQIVEPKMWEMDVFVEESVETFEIDLNDDSCSSYCSSD